MMIHPGYVYFFSDEYFKDVQDPFLMKNKGQHHNRPVYCCKEDPELGIFWMVPMTSQIEKFRNRFAHSYAKYGNCLGLVLGHYCGRNAVFLVQNAFPITAKYILDIYQVNSKPVPVHSKLQRIIYSKFQQSLAIHKKGHDIFFTDIDRAKQIMIDSFSKEKRSLTEVISLADERRQNISSAHPRVFKETSR